MKSALEVANIFRRDGATYRADHAATLSNSQRRVMAAIEACRTSALGGHVERCADCGEIRIAYNSCFMGKISNGESVPDPTRSDGGCAVLPAFLSP